MSSIEGWLRRFEARQSWLLFLQGLSLGGLALLAGASVIMVLDAIGIISDPWRWTCTICVEVSALALGIAHGLLQPWVRRPLTRVATDAESICPEMREQLLACVELSSVKESARNFSGDFLAALQGRVAHALREHSIRDLLPWSTVRGPCLAALASCLAIVGLCFFSRLDMPQRLRRALIPFADLERLSRTRIEVVKPSRPVSVVPENQAVEFEIQLSGAAAQEASMEWRAANGKPASGTKLEKMIRIDESPARFVCSLPIGTDSIEYRFAAGDGRTSWRTIRPTPRPRVARFKHRIHFPEYTGLPPSEIVGERGSITALADSQIEVGFEPSIPLISANANVEKLDSGEQETVSLTYAKDQSVWSFPWRSDADMRYRLKLKANMPDSDEPIENTFSPTHELNTASDHRPAVGWMATDGTLWDVPPRPEQAWIISPEELVPLAARIADDLPGATIEQQISINRGPWTSVSAQLRSLSDEKGEQTRSLPGWLDSNAWTPLDGVENPTNASFTWVWDVLNAGASSGDTIAVRIAARDSLQQVTYSPTVEFSLASPGFDRNRHDPLLARAALLPELVRLSTLMRGAKESLTPRLQQARSNNMPAPERTKLAEDLRSAAKQWSDCSRDIRILSHGIIRQLPRPLDQSETEFVVRLIAKLERDHTSTLTAAADILSVESGKEQRLIQRIADRIDQALRGVNEGDDHSHRLVDIYRQFLGHETLTALTKDMLYLKQHQEDQLQRLEKMDFAMLARSQKIATQYIDSIQALGKRMEPLVSQHLQNGLRSWGQTLDQTRTELNHRSQQESTPENRTALANEVKRVTENLRHQSWAFNLDGGLWWNIADTRRDLIQRGMGLHVLATQTLERMEREQAELADKNIPSELLQQLRAISMQSAENRSRAVAQQMVDRRELHQHRMPIDPQFASDMGLAMRAWESQLELWAAFPTINEESRKQKDVLIKIIQAYRVLETAHEMHDVRVTAETLQRHEQYEWESLEGKLAHVRIWDSLPNRIDNISQWMKESGFQHPVADAYRAVQWNDSCNSLRRKLDPRRHANNENLVSFAAELEDWLTDLRVAEGNAQPTIDEARRFLASLSPSLSELARRSARETRALQEQSKTDPEQTVAPRELQQQLQQTQQSIERLQDALLENAMRQDILDEQQLDVAKDSDRASQWLNELTPPMQSATESLLRAQQAAENTNQIETASEQAVQQQEAVAAALETIEKHFAMLEDPALQASAQAAKQLEQSRAQLNPKAEPDRQPLESYDAADQLSSMANRDPAALLQELEKELERNEPMQRELSQLSQQAAADTIAQLKNAAKEESSIVRDLENADVARKGAKELQTQQLRRLGDEVDRMAASMLEKSSQVVQRMNLPETRKSIHQAMEDLRSSANQAKNSDAQQPAMELDRKFQKLMESVDQAQKKLDELTPAIQGKIEQAVAKDEQQRQGQLTEMKSWQSLMRDDSVRRAKDQARELQQASDQAQKQAEQRNQDLQQKLQARKQVMDQLKASPNRDDLKDALDRNTMAASQATAETENAKRLAESAQKLAKESAERAQAIENAARANLDRPNPVASLAEEQIAAANKELQAIRQEMQNGAKPDHSSEPKPNASALAQGKARQDQVTETVEQLAEQMARSARHEERLMNDTGSRMLAEQAKAIDQAASNPIAQAQQELKQASQRASQAERDQAQGSREAPTPNPTAPPGAGLASQRTQQAADTLSQLARNIEQNVAPMFEATSEAREGRPNRAEPAPSAKPDPGQPTQTTQPEPNAKTQSESSRSVPSEKNGTQQSRSGLPSQSQSNQTSASESSNQAQAQANSQSQAPSGFGESQSPKEMARLLDSLDQQLNGRNGAPNDSGQSGRSDASDSSSEGQQGQNSQSQPTGQDSPSPSSLNQDTKPQNGEGQRESDGVGRDTAQSKSRGNERLRDALRESADEIAARLQNERLAKARNRARDSRSSKNTSRSASATEPDDQGRTQNAPAGDSRLPAVVNRLGQDWGSLREQRAEDVTQGKRDVFDPEYSDAIRAYFRALGERKK